MSVLAPHHPYAAPVAGRRTTWSPSAVVAQVRDLLAERRHDAAVDGHTPVLTWRWLVLGCVLGLLIHGALVALGATAAVATTAGLVALAAVTLGGWATALHRELATD